MEKVILIHGSGHKAASWNETVSRLDCRGDVLCPELSSLLMGKEASYPNLRIAFEAYCAQVGGSVHLCGLSLGGILALHYGIEHPEKVNALALIGVPYPMPRGLMRLQNGAFRLMPRSVFQRMGWEKADFLALCRSMLSVDFSEKLERIECPTLILCGDGDKANRSAALRLSERIEKAKLDWIPQAGHEVNQDQPAALGRKLQAFFSQANRL